MNAIWGSPARRRGTRRGQAEIIGGLIVLTLIFMFAVPVLLNAYYGAQKSSEAAREAQLNLLVAYNERLSIGPVPPTELALREGWTPGVWINNTGTVPVTLDKLYLIDIRNNTIYAIIDLKTARPSTSRLISKMLLDVDPTGSASKPLPPAGTPITLNPGENLLIVFDKTEIQPLTNTLIVRVESSTGILHPLGGGGGNGGSSGRTSGEGGSSGGGGSPPAGPALTVTIQNTRLFAVRLGWVPVVIDSSHTSFWDGVSSDGSDVYVTTESGKPVHYALYIVKDSHYAVVWIEADTTLEPGAKLVYKIHYGGPNKYPNYRTSVTWHWVTVADLNLWPRKTHHLYTQIKEETISEYSIYVFTGPYWDKHDFDVAAPYRHLAIAWGFYFDEYEEFLATGYDVIFTTIDGTKYKLGFTSCWLFGPEATLYKWVSEGWVVVSAKETGCYYFEAHQRVGVITKGAPEPPVNALFKVDKPINYIEIMPAGGDSGMSWTSVYLYIPNLPVTLPEGVKVTVAP